MRATLRRVRASCRHPSTQLQLGYLAALLVSTATTLLTALALPTGEFAVVTESLIIAAVAPLLLSWGIPDAITFRSLRASAEPAVFSAGLAVSACLAILACAATAAYALWQGLSNVDAVLTGVASAAAMAGMTCQGIDLALDRLRRVALLALAPSTLSLTLILFLLVTVGLSATGVILARATGALVVLALRAVLLLPELRRHLSSTEVGQLLKLGTPIHVSSVLAAGSLRLEQALIAAYFPAPALAAYGLILPAVNGIRTLLYAAGTTRAVALAKERNTSLLACHRRALPLATGGVAVGLLSAVGVVVAMQVTGHSETMSWWTVLLFMAGGTMSGIIDVLVRMYRGSGDARGGMLGRLAGFGITLSIGPWLVASGVGPASLVGVLSGAAAYLVLLMVAAQRRDER